MSNILNLEIYEFLLENYNEDEIGFNMYSTESIFSSKDTDCGKIKVTTADLIKNNNIRSCDPISGTIKKINAKRKLNGEIEKGKIDLIPFDKNYKDIKFNINGILSDHLIKFINIYGAKIHFREVVNTTDMTSLNNIYNLKYIYTLVDDVKKILVNEWITQGHQSTKTLIKFHNPQSNAKFIIFGDFHGAFSTFIRTLLRLRKMNILNENCKLLNNYNIIFLGDIIDRAMYDYELLILIYELIRLNPKKIHYIRGNHEEKDINEKNGLLEHINMQFNSNIIYGPNIESESDNEIQKNELHNKINELMIYQYSALVMKNPNNNKYIYMSHGGLPIIKRVEYGDNYAINPIFIEKLQSEHLMDSNLELDLDELNTIRWGDYAGTLNSMINKNGDRLIIGYDIIKHIKELNIELILRGHQDQFPNTKILKRNNIRLVYGKNELELQDRNNYSKYFVNIQDIPSFNQPEIKIMRKYNCKRFTHLINVSSENEHPNVIINKTEYLDLLPVITLSTNTDLQRELTKDSFAILKFIENPEDLLNSCYEETNAEEKEIADSNYLKYLEESRKKFVKEPVSQEPIYNISGSTRNNAAYTANARRGGFYEKYMKYKQKYLQLKSKI
jgi:hypothetical protein